MDSEFQSHERHETVMYDVMRNQKYPCWRNDLDVLKFHVFVFMRATEKFLNLLWWCLISYLHLFRDPRETHFLFLYLVESYCHLYPILHRGAAYLFYLYLFSWCPGLMAHLRGGKELSLDVMRRRASRQFHSQVDRPETVEMYKYGLDPYE